LQNELHRRNGALWSTFGFFPWDFLERRALKPEAARTGAEPAACFRR
jgi:hypothetical protein